jgi:hypothetical protein
MAETLISLCTDLMHTRGAVLYFMVTPESQRGFMESTAKKYLILLKLHPLTAPKKHLILLKLAPLIAPTIDVFAFNK